MPKRKASTPSHHREQIAALVLWIRGEKVILDRDLAELYGITTKVLKQAVRRNIDRFPEDFMFELSNEEVDAMQNPRSQFVTLESGHNIKYPPMAFTEQGVAMLSSVLRSLRAIEVNIAIMRTFVQLRHMMDSNKELARKIENLEKKYDEHFQTVFRAIQELIKEDEKPKGKIGFQA